MPTVNMPQLGESVEEGTIGAWLKEVGDHVRVGDPLVEVVTDKVNAEVPSPFEGTLTKILVAEGDTVGNDAAIAEIEVDAAAAAAVEEEALEAATREAATPAQAAADATAADAAAAQAATATGAALDQATDATATATAADAAAAQAATAPRADAAATEAAANAAAPAVATAAAAAAAAAPAAPAIPATSAGNNGSSSTAVAVPVGSRMTPAVRRLARERGVDVNAIVGSGTGGRVTRADVEAAPPGSAPIAPAPATTTPAAAAPAPAAAAPAPAAAPPARTPDSPVVEGDSLKRLSPMRKAIAAHMTKFLDVPTAYITVEVDMTPVVRARGAVNAAYKAREGMSLSYVAYMTKACVAALAKHHDINAHWTEEGHWRRKEINVGIAVAVPDGLLVPVIRNADTLSLHGLNSAINDLAKRSRNKKIKPDELKGGTFTVDNTGWTGSVLTLPIINVPEVAIITMEKIVKRPVVIEDQGDAIAIRSMMNMCIAIDHRATDGAQAGEFLADVRAWLESVDENTPIW